MLKIKPNVFVGVIFALLLIVPLISVMTVRYEPLLDDSFLATIYKRETFSQVCFIALYAVGYALTSFVFWIIKEIDNEFFEKVFGKESLEPTMLKLLFFAPMFAATFLNPLMNYITNY